MDRALFRELYAAHAKPIFAFLLARTNDRELAADLLQDVFLKTWNRIEAVAAVPADERLYWLFAVAANRLKDQYRRSANRKRAEERLEAGPGAGPGDLSGVLAGRERMRELEAQIARLPEELRGLLLMKVLGGLSSVQIGAATGLPAGTVRYKISQARKLLAEGLRLTETAPAGAEREVKEHA
ncbi:RNA polymerase sigma-70 factor, ECF subfamily [Paenibacillus sp. UNC496MF]|uniref:RNA polymerase sigma factor n=1 Tax=Paenibacillus sp. UNC496MF TaxID=1502753 RepID=UPI0008E65B67|nr:sigma-70 family RNA polymerase sigma factor [Paenibacillus sp. UNC496MF]SFJ74062.1 RNA polymerase sigma-70 factor, ECF subfamily [Paenibacillus sp. UNC496MF]